MKDRRFNSKGRFAASAGPQYRVFSVETQTHPMALESGHESGRSRPIIPLIWMNNNKWATGPKFQLYNIKASPSHLLFHIS